MTNTKEPSKSEKKLHMTKPLKKAFYVWKKGNANASDEA
jgi:hypothetical protein